MMIQKKKRKKKSLKEILSRIWNYLLLCSTEENHTGKTFLIYNLNIILQQRLLLKLQLKTLKLVCSYLHTEGHVKINLCEKKNII